MMKKHLFYVVCYTIAIITLSSCTAQRQTMLYLQDMEDTKEYPVIQKYEAVIQRDDKLEISVSSKNPELALAFNIPGTGGYNIGADGTISATQSNSSTSRENKPGYTVDIHGNIEFPVLGTLHVEGLTKNQLVNLITNKLKDEELLKDPIVLVEFLNFKISILGEVNRVGQYNVSGDRLTLLDAIAMAGDLTKNARLDRIAVIREYGNKRRIMWNDIRTKDIFTSPSYYLQQNDIVYVETNGRRAEEVVQRRFSMWHTVIYSITSVISLIILFTKL